MEQVSTALVTPPLPPMPEVNSAFTALKTFTALTEARDNAGYGKPDACSGCALIAQKMVLPDGNRNPDILFVGGLPTEMDVERGAFTSRAAMMVRSIMDRINRDLPAKDHPTKAYCYAVRCAIPRKKNTGNKYDAPAEKVDMDTISRCRRHLDDTILRHRPKLVLAFGSDAMKGLDFKGKFSDARGVFMDRKIGDHSFKMLVTMHPFAVTADPGKFDLLYEDLVKAVNYVKGNTEEITLDIRTPRAFNAVMAELIIAEQYITQHWETTQSPLAVSVDTETTSLDPWRPTEKIIAVSMSYKDKLGLSFPFEHRDEVYTAEQFEMLKNKVEQILSMDAVAIIEHNAKFDTQWLKLRYGLRINQAVYCTMVGEHILFEDKKGNYDLKTLTSDNFPSLGGYEENLQAALEALQAEKEADYKVLVGQNKEEVRRIFVDEWMSMSEDARLSLLAKWVVRGLLPMGKGSDAMATIKKKKQKGEYVTTKGYIKAVVALLNKLPEEEHPVPANPLPDEEEFTKVTFEDINLDTLLPYAAVDAAVTRMLLIKQMAGMDKDTVMIADVAKRIGRRRLPTEELMWGMDNISMPLCHNLAEMEFNGVRMDRDKIIEDIKIVEFGIEEAKRAMFESIGREFNPAGNDLARILFDEMDLPVLKRSEKTGDPSTDAETLKELSDLHDLPFLNKVLDFRKMEKVKGTYLEAWLRRSAVDGRIHCSFNQIGTATMRLSSSAPNLQNVPYMLYLPKGYVNPAGEKIGYINLKDVFLPDSDEFDMYELDISNAEMRVLTAYSRDPTLIDVFTRDLDMHCMTASGVKGAKFSYEQLMLMKDDKKSEEYTERQCGKKTNFLTIFGGGAKTLMEQLWSELRIRVTEEVAQAFLDGFFSTYPGVKSYMEATPAFVQQFHFTYTFLGRRRRFPIIGFSKSLGFRAGRQSVNARVQGTSSDLVNINLIDVAAAIKPLGGRVILTVHDSILFQLPKGVTGVKSMLDELITERVRTRFPWMPVAWKYDVAWGPTYGMCKNPVTDAGTLSLAA